MRILVTGATGYIGKKLIQRLKENKHQIFVIVRPTSETDDIKDSVEKIIYAQSYLDLYEEVQKISPEVYVNLAGYYCGSHTSASIEPLMDGNLIFPSYVLDAVVKSGCNNIIHTASYQQSYNGEYYHPINLYAATKQAFEDVIYFYCTSNQVKAITLQLFDTYGADDTRNKVFNYVRRLHENESIDMSPGMQKLYFCYIDDVIGAYVHAIEVLNACKVGFYERYAVRSKEPIALKAFVEKYISLIGKNIELNWGKRDYMAKEIMDPTGYGDILKGWSPHISYDEGLKLCAQYDRKSIIEQM